MKDFLGKEIKIGDMVITHTSGSCGLSAARVKKINKIKLTLEPRIGFSTFRFPKFTSPENVAIVNEVK